MVLELKSTKVGVLNEYKLHAQLKNHYCKNYGEKEKQIGNYVVDVFQNNELIEIQSKNFSQIKLKLLNLLENKYNVRLVYPIIVEKWNSTIEANSQVKQKRKSPKKANIFQLFDELVYLIDVFDYTNFKLEVILISALEIRKKVNFTNKRTKYKVIDRQLINIQKTFMFNKKEDFLFILPYTLPVLFSTKELEEELKLKYKLISKIVYVFRELNLIEQVKKVGNRKYYQKSIF